MTIHEIIKANRISRSLTQEMLAEQLNVTPQAVSRWETGISSPDIALLPKIADIFNVSIDELLGTNSDSDEQSDNAEEVGLTQRQIDAIFNRIPGIPGVTGKKVLFADDAPYLRMMIPQILSEQNHKVFLAENGLEAVEIVNKEKPEYCILDINMPVMDGLEALSKIKSSHPNMKVIMLTAMAERGTVEKAKELGADDYILKPFAPADIIARIR